MKMTSSTVRLCLSASLFGLFGLLSPQSVLGMADLFSGPNGQHLTSRGWTAYSSAGSGAVLVTNGGTNGLAHLTSANTEDVARTFGGYSSDRATDRFLYYKARLSITALPASGQPGDYFVALRDSVSGETRGHVWLKYNTSVSAKIGISYLATDAPVYPIGTLPLNGSTEIVVKIDRGDGTVKPSAMLTVIDAVNGNKTATSTTAADETFTPDTIALRQSNTTGGMGDLLIDEVLTGTTWNDVYGPLYEITDAAYGASPSSTVINDDQVGIQAAITACKTSNKHGIVVFPPGRYDVTGDHYSTATGGLTAFYIFNMTDLTIQGNGAVIMMRSSTSDATAAITPLWAQAFYIASSTNTVIKGLTIDWKRPPFTVGTVASVTTDIANTQWTVKATVDTAAFPMPATNIADHDARWNVESVIDWEPVTGYPLSNMSFYDQTDGNIVSSYDAAAQQWTLVLHYGGTNAEVKTHLTNTMAALVNRKLVLRHKTGGTSSPDIYGHNCIDVNVCTNTQFQDVAINASAGMALHAAQSTDFVLSRFKIQPSSAARLMSSLVDGTFFTFCKGAIVIDNCYYKNTGDDSANVNAKFMIVKSIAGSVATVVPGVGVRGPQGLTGEVFEFMTGGDHSLIDPATTHSLTANAIANANADGAGTDGWDLPFNTVSGLAVGDIVVTTAWSPALQITDTTFDGSHARGVIISTRNVLIDNCAFRYQAFNGIMVMADPSKSGAQGPGAQNVSITNNTFEACGAAPIALVSHSGGGAPSRPSAAGMFRNFYIEGNTFRRNRPGVTTKINDLRLARATPGGAGNDMKMAYYQSAIVLNALDVVGAADLNTVDSNTFTGTGAADGFEPVIYLNHVANQFSTAPAGQISIANDLSSGMLWRKSSVTPAPNITGGAGCLLPANQLTPDLLDNALEGYDRQLGDVR